MQIKIPYNVSSKDAATLGIGLFTVGQSLYQSLGLPLPTQPATERFPILIYGGSTATGTLAIQFAKLYAEIFTLPTCIFCLQNLETITILDLFILVFVLIQYFSI